MMKPRAVPQLILKLQEHRQRESALRLLSSYLYEVTVVFYFLLYNFSNFSGFGRS